MSVYQRANVTVDENFARFGSKSYAINKITSVDVRDNSRTSSAWIIFVLISVISSLIAFDQIGSSGGSIGGAIVAALVFGGIAFIMFRGRRTESYVLMLATAAGEVQATQSASREAILELRGVLERRIAGLPD